MYFRDPEFMEKVVAFLVRDRNFLKKTSGLLEVADFKPRKSERGDSARLGKAIHLVSKISLDFWNEYREPIGGLLKTYVLDEAREKKLGSRQKEVLLDLIHRIRRTDGLVAVDALEKKVVQYKARQKMRDTINALIEAQEEGKLADVHRFRRIVEENLVEFDRAHDVTDYLAGLEKRITRREGEKLREWPYLFIDCIDGQIKTIPRGALGLILGPYKIGKSTIFVWLAQVMALQGYNVLLFTLEDPKETVEDRLDASLCNITLGNLSTMPVKLRKRFVKVQNKLRGKIRIVDGTGGAVSVTKIEDIWEAERNHGFAADVVLIDYDDEIAPPEHYKQSDGRRREFADIYRALRKFASKRDVYVWTAAQTKRHKGKDPKEKITGDDVAEDISKVRKAAFTLGIGFYPKFGENGRYLHVAAHKWDKGNVGGPICGNFSKGVFYDRERTMRKLIELKSQIEEE